ncbi:hypothetical protein PYCCODRAFT_775303 [Trametes coccinea BRFM310]|uniref:Uncharacterized protein n=1 Tax=Trametes coccinea (strain BRFM310) TaxID=1353009 RepID=A0A1Y2J0H1_TRAC3|nr:hypothetical protein PYCCODRAFT_775303 [Trametes coccinea BRFM310]
MWTATCSLIRNVEVSDVRMGSLSLAHPGASAWRGVDRSVQTVYTLTTAESRLVHHLPHCPICLLYGSR